MGWASGSVMMSRIIEGLREKVNDTDRRVVYEVLIEAFEEHDCDTLGECIGSDSVFDAAYDDADPCGAGYRAYFRGEPSSANPHLLRTKKGRKWKSGWEEAKLDDKG